MTTEKLHATEKFMDSISYGRSIVQGIVENPELIKNPTYRDFGFKTALTVYKAGLYKQGIAPEIILESVRHIQDGVSKRKNRLGFITMVSNTFDQKQSIEPDPTDAGLVKIEEHIKMNGIAQEPVVMEKNTELSLI